ncbi:MAG: hypothetical protein JXR44_08720 [Thiotrichales bacterium]|nr:hypothetical protein [Thiotrichales bacterium]
MSIEMLTEFLGWLSIINIAILLLSSLSLIAMRRTITQIHAKLFGLNEQDLGRLYFQYLAQYKIAVMVLNIAPYLALKLMSAA